MSALDRTTILLVDDHDLIRTGIRLSLEQLKEFTVVGEAIDGPSAVKKALALRPDVVLMDIGLPGMDGIEATWQIKQTLPQCRVLMLTSHESETDIMASLGAGADGFCSKDISVENLSRAVRTVDSGQQWLESAISQRICRSFTQADRRPSAANLQSKQSIVFEREISMMRLVEKSYTVVDSDTPCSVDNFLMGLKNPPVLQRLHQAIAETGCTSFADKYTLEAAISEGGMGIVYKARHMDMDKVVAIKVLRDDRIVDRRIIRWFNQEAKAASSLSHQNIISVFDFGVTENGQPFLVMDYIDGNNLDHAIMTEGRLEINRFFNIFLQVCDGLASAHRMNVIHCDLKPSNIMLVGSGNDECVKIVDFGLAKIIPRTNSVATQMTDRFEVAGSPLYMSPEQCLGQKLDFRSDIYSLGCVMYEALTGHNIFQTESAFETFGCQLRESPKPFKEICPQITIPAGLESIIFKTFNKAPELRHQSVRELKQDLMAVLAGARV